MQDNEHQDDANQHATREQAFATNGGTGGAKTQTKICQRCGTDGHTSIKCDSRQDKVAIYRQSQQPNQGVSQLINAESNQGVSELANAVDWNVANSTDDEAQYWTFLNQAILTSDGPIKWTEYNEDGSIAQIHKSTIFSQANSGIPYTWYLLDN
jgi:hypothetical protein